MQDQPLKLKEFWVDHVVNVFAAFLVGLDDGCFGFDERGSSFQGGSQFGLVYFL